MADVQGPALNAIVLFFRRQPMTDAGQSWMKKRVMFTMQPQFRLFFSF